MSQGRPLAPGAGQSGRCLSWLRGRMGVALAPRQREEVNVPGAWAVGHEGCTAGGVPRGIFSPLRCRRRRIAAAMHPTAMEVLPILRRSLLVALALLLTACPRPSRTPPAGGDTGEEVPTGDPFPKRPTVEAKKDATADAALAQARQTAQAAPDKKKAAEAYLSVRKAYPATTAGQDALYQAGVLFFESKDYVNARKSFNELLFENPLYNQAEDAKRKLALSAMEVGAYRDAYQTLSSLAERAEGAEREQLLRDAARAAEGAGLYGQSLTMAVEQAGQAKTQQERDAAVARVEALVEGRADFVDIARVAEGLPSSNP